MKLAWVILMISHLIGCSSRSSGRKLTSMEDPKCHLKRHATKNYYRVYHRNKLLYEHWYEEKYAMQLMKEAMRMGQCR